MGTNDGRTRTSSYPQLMAGVLYLVATPIGNYDDITLRALDVLRSADIIVCEERKVGEKFLRHFNIGKPVDLLNEHNESASTFHIIQSLKAGKSVAVISDGGTPVFSDPGQLLVAEAVELSIRVVPIPGASSLLPAITVSGFSCDRFLFYGWLSPKKERRRSELRQLRAEKRTIILMDTPYRFSSVLRDLSECFGDSRRMCIAYNLTMADEEVFHGTAKSLYKELSGGKIKGEYVIVVEGKGIQPGNR